MIQEENNLQKAKDYAAKLLARYPRTIAEIKGKLAMKKFDSDVIEGAIQYFIEGHILSDEKYAKDWIESQLRNRPTSRAICRKKMYQKGLSCDLINKALDDYYTADREQDIAYELALKKIKLIKEESIQKKKMKVGQFLDSKGFSESIIWSVLERIDFK